MDINIDEEIANELKNLENGDIFEKENKQASENISLGVVDTSRYENFLQEISSSEDVNKFQFLAQANVYISEIEKHISDVVGKVKIIYAQKYPQLPSLVTNIYDYIRAVQCIEKGLKCDFLPSSNFISVSFMLSTSKASSLSSFDSQKLTSYCDTILKLYSIQKKLLQFISENISAFAPNLTALVGADIAGKLITATGGVVELSKLPSSHIINLGNSVVNSEGFSTRNKLHNGFLCEVEEYKKATDEMKMKVLRRYSNKVALAARKDAFNNKIDSGSDKVKNPNDDEYGKKLHTEIGQKLSNVENNKQPVIKKPLPRPDDKPRRKRGGKRSRSTKKRYEMTEVRLLKNRIKFGEEGEIDLEDFGMLKNSNKIRGFNIERNKNKIVTKKIRQIDAKYAKYNSNITSGIHSSVVMTPVSGIELINPDILNKKDPTQTSYFERNSGFDLIGK